jgi:hypothetical protein
MTSTVQSIRLKVPLKGEFILLHIDPSTLQHRTFIDDEQFDNWISSLRIKLRIHHSEKTNEYSKCKFKYLRKTLICSECLSETYCGLYIVYAPTDDMIQMSFAWENIKILQETILLVLYRILGKLVMKNAT